MGEACERKLSTTYGELPGVASYKPPVVFYPFGAQTEATSSDSDVSAGPRRVTVEDPRVIHTRPAPPAQVDAAAGEQDEQDAHATDTGSVSVPGRDEHSEPHRTAPTSTAADNPGCTVEPLPQSYALIQVRKHIMTCDSSMSSASPGRLVAERFSVGWMVYTPAVGGQNTDTVYYVTDDGELEKSSPAAGRSVYLESVEKRFWLRRAMFE